MLDTASSYGMIEDEHFLLNKLSFGITTKFTIRQLDIYRDVLSPYISIKKAHLYGVLLHDAHLYQMLSSEIIDILNKIRVEYNVKVGFSVYSPEDLNLFLNIFIPDILQVPLNPFNQSFNSYHFENYVKNNSIEVHARSLFLQGVLLQDEVHPSLAALKEHFDCFKQEACSFPSLAHALLKWGDQFDWIKRWVIGVNSSNQLNQIIETSKDIKSIDILPKFSHVTHQMVDPRNW